MFPAIRRYEERSGHFCIPLPDDLGLTALKFGRKAQMPIFPPVRSTGTGLPFSRVGVRGGRRRNVRPIYFIKGKLRDMRASHLFKETLFAKLCFALLFYAYQQLLRLLVTSNQLTSSLCKAKRCYAGRSVHEELERVQKMFRANAIRENHHPLERLCCDKQHIFFIRLPKKDCVCFCSVCKSAACKTLQFAVRGDIVKRHEVFVACNKIARPVKKFYSYRGPTCLIVKRSSSGKLKENLSHNEKTQRASRDVNLFPLIWLWRHNNRSRIVGFWGITLQVYPSEAVW